MNKQGSGSWLLNLSLWPTSCTTVLAWIDNRQKDAMRVFATGRKVSLYTFWHGQLNAPFSIFETPEWVVD